MSLRRFALQRYLVTSHGYVVDPAEFELKLEAVNVHAAHALFVTIALTPPFFRFFQPRQVVGAPARKGKSKVGPNGGRVDCLLHPERAVSDRVRGDSRLVWDGGGHGSGRRVYTGHRALIPDRIRG